MESYPSYYGTVSSDELISLHGLVERLGGVVSLVSFRLTSENAQRFAEEEAAVFAPRMGIDQPDMAAALHKLALQDAGQNKLAIILHGPDPNQLGELVADATFMVAASDLES